MPNLVKYLIMIGLGLLMSFSGIAQEEINLSTPYHTVLNHLQYLDEENFDKRKSAKSFLPKFSRTKRERFAVELKNFYDGKGLLVDLSHIPRYDTYKDTTTDKSIYYLFPNKYPEIYLIKVGKNWYYSEETALSVNRLYREIFPAWADNLLSKLPKQFNNTYLGIAGWQYLGIFLIILAALLLQFILSWSVDRLLKRSLWRRLRIGEEHHRILYDLAKYISLMVLMYAVMRMIPILLLDVHLSAFMMLAIRIIQAVFLFMALMKVIGILEIYMKLLSSKTETKMDDQLVPVISKMAKILIGVVVFIHLLSILGVNVTALIAGASIGGLALALAAQDTFKNLFGSVMIFLDKPFHIGDFISTSEIQGTVEEVGFRSTRIRKVDTSVISVPNGNLANVTLTNLGIRRYRIYENTLGISYLTPLENIQDFVTKLRQIPTEFDQINSDNWLINAHTLGPKSIDVFFRVYVETDSLKSELNLREAIVFSIMEKARNAGVSFAVHP